jgi:NAD(P)-dependent dehydrogenase (short-subunit alcohol dehydrogenase family)
MQKRILIIGAERGLGLGLAAELLSRGWQVAATSRDRKDQQGLGPLGAKYGEALGIESVDLLVQAEVESLCEKLSGERFDVVFCNAGVWGPAHQSASQITSEEVVELMMTNSFGPIRFARRALELEVLKPGGTLSFMSSHRGSVAANLEGGLELYRASKAALNMMARGIHAEQAGSRLTVLSIHPGWAATTMGTLNGAVQAEITVEESVKGVAAVLEQRMGSGENSFVDYQNRIWPW